MKPSFDLDAPDLFTTGAVGPPGQRVFYLQGRENGQVVTLKAEKEQVSALAEYLASLLSRLPAVTEPVPGDLALLEPLEVAWNVGTIGVGYDETRDRIIVVASEVAEQEEDDDDEAEAPDDVAEATAIEEEIVQALLAEQGAVAEPPGAEAAEPEAEGKAAAARFQITRAQAAAFVERGRALVRAGRPICPICSQPKDPGGHVCPRSNGHVVRS